MKRIKILARKNLKMSPGKLAAQSVHAALALACQEELHPMMSVVVLEVNGKPFEDAKANNNPVAVVRDAGYTEVAPGTETCIAFLEDDPRLSQHAGEHWTIDYTELPEEVSNAIAEFFNAAQTKSG
jgi:peptidyl-tRNA hydrolase